MRAAVKALPTDNDRSDGHYPKGITDEQKGGLLCKGWGLHPFNQNAAADWRVHCQLGCNLSQAVRLEARQDLER